MEHLDITDLLLKLLNLLFLITRILIKKVKVSQSCLTLCDPHGLYSPWNSLGQNTGVGSLSLLQGIFTSQGSNLGLLHWQPVIAVITNTPLMCIVAHLQQRLISLNHQRKIFLAAGGRVSECEWVKVAQSCLTLCDPHGLYSPWNSPGQNTEVGSLSLLQGIFLTQGLNPGVPHCGRFFTSWATREAQEHWSG